MEDKKDLIKSLSANRTFLMGFAMLWIVLAHLWAHLELPQGRMLKILYDCIFDGYGGCDIFLCLSGFGLAHSLERDPSPGRFLKRRAKKLLPSYYPFILVYIGFMAATAGITGKEALGDLTFTGFWFHWSRQFNWYIQALPAFYLLALLCRWSEGKLGTRRSAAFMFCLALVLNVLFYGHYQMVAVTRVPLFLFGYYLSKRQIPICVNGKGTMLLAAALVLGVAALRMTEPIRTWENGLYWYPFYLIAPALCFLLAQLRPFCQKWKILRLFDRFLCLFGTCSLEIYLIHDFAMEWVFPSMTGNLRWILLAALSCALGIGYHYLAEASVKKLTRTKTAT